MVTGASVISAQTDWSPAGATWHYRVWREDTETDGIIVFRYEGDTVVGGLVSKKINSKFYGRMHFYTPLGGVAEYKQQITRAAGNVLFVNLPGTAQFDTIVNFDAKPGDTWRAPRRYECQNRRIIEVVDTSHLLFQAFFLKTVTVRYTVTDLQKAVTFTTTFTEKIYNGNLSAPCFDMFAMSCDHPVPQNSCEYPSFRCYQDDSFPLYNTNPQECMAFVDLPENRSQLSLGVFPNPFVDGFTVKGEILRDPLAVISVIDMRGSEVSRQSSPGEDHFYLSAIGLDPGIYLLRVIRNGVVIRQHRILRTTD